MGGRTDWRAAPARGGGGHLAGVVQEGGVKGAPDGLVAAEGEGDIGDAAADLAAGAHLRERTDVGRHMTQQAFRDRRN